ncbi:hypothetical protein E1B28_002844 [Marasmius oreades]|uniref:Uncharacterized protein n=1 Tax=Marasmius oreades TaxID=181124 RepID=A0A9P7UM16_9AGAR|nr:uncharacterized protein E1B28_002844 [Marasmius oreades]KAG7086928.1 hypothetical protein E1B28_002844 [Marasmius oreades]
MMFNILYLSGVFGQHHAGHSPTGDWFTYQEIMLSLHLIPLLRVHQSTLAAMVSPLERVLHSIIASRVVLHLRQVAPRGYVQNWDTINGITTEELTREYTEMSFVSNALRSDIEPQS